MIDNKDSQKRYRVDHLIEAKADQLTEAGKGNSRGRDNPHYSPGSSCLLYTSRCV